MDELKETEKERERERETWREVERLRARRKVADEYVPILVPQLKGNRDDN